MPSRITRPAGSSDSDDDSRSSAKLIVNLTRGTVVCERACLADSPLRRMRGLMWRRDLPATEGMLLRPAPAIHSAFMRFSFDALFLDSDLQVLRVVDELRPWRIAGQRGAHAVLELAAGERDRRGVEVGDRLALLDRPNERFGWNMDETGVRSEKPVAAIEAIDDGEPDGMRVLLAAPDRRFRHAAALLLTRRGCTVSVAESIHAAVEMAERHAAEVVVLDAGRSLTSAAQQVATLEAMVPPVGVVVVADEAEEGIVNLPVLDRWGSFEELFAAVEDAHRNRAHRKSLVERG